MDDIRELTPLVLVVSFMLFIAALIVGVYFYMRSFTPYFVYGSVFLVILLILYSCFNYGRKLHNARELESLEFKREQAEIELLNKKSLLLDIAVSNGMNVRVGDVEISHPVYSHQEVRKIVDATLSQKFVEYHEQQQITAKSSASSAPTIYQFSDELRDFTPTKEGIFLARSNNGTAIIEKPTTLMHGALTGATGGGKSTFMRLVLIQLLYLGYKVYYSDINYRPVNKDPNTKQVIYWQSIASKLATSPILTAQATYDTALKLVELMEERRIAAREKGITEFQPVYFLIEEIPALVSEMEVLGVPLTKLLRESRQWGIYIVCTMQDALCKTMKLDNGVLSNLKTAIYTGGDVTTAKKVLNLGQGNKLVDHEKLGKNGLVYLKTPSIESSLVTIPYPDNDACFKLLGSPGKDQSIPAMPNIEDLIYD